jgi:hypothetical protein
MQLELDSVIVNDDELTRKRLKMEVARKYFNLVGLEKIAVFNRYGGRLGDAEFIRVECLDEMIEAGYTAVFKSEMKISAAKNDPYYCISQGKTTFTEQLWNWHVLADPELDRQLMKTFALDSQKVLKITHVRIDDLDATYSSVSLQGDGSSMLVETKGGKSVVLMTLEKDYSLGRLDPVHFSYHNRPVFNSAMMPNETDGYFEVLLAFNGEEYEALPRSRAK